MSFRRSFQTDQSKRSTDLYLSSSFTVVDSTHLQVVGCLLLDREGEDSNKAELDILEWAVAEGVIKGEGEGMDLRVDKDQIKEGAHQVSKVSVIQIQVTVREEEARREGMEMELMEVGTNKINERDIKDSTQYSISFILFFLRNFKMYSYFPLSIDSLFNLPREAERQNRIVKEKDGIA